MRQGLEVWRAAGAELLARPSHVAGLAEVYAEIGRIEEGLELLAESVAVLGKTGESWWEAELYRLKGELTLKKSEMPGDPYWGASTQAATEAEGCLRNAIDIARRQSAKSLELRAVTSLSRPLTKQGEKDKARRMLAEIYGWFTEGFNTADLKEARAVLEELS